MGQKRHQRFGINDAPVQQPQADMSLTPGMLETTSKVTPQPGMVLRVDILRRKLCAKPWRPGFTLTQILFLRTSCMSAGWLSCTTTRTVRYTRCSGHAPPRLSWGLSWTVESHDASALTCSGGVDKRTWL